MRRSANTPTPPSTGTSGGPSRITTIWCTRVKCSPTGLPRSNRCRWPLDRRRLRKPGPSPASSASLTVVRQTRQTSNSTGGVSARPFARFASRWSNVANLEARELRAMCSVSAKSRSLSNASSATRTASRTGQQRRRVKVLQATRGAARRSLHHARHPRQIGGRDRPDDAQLQPIRLFEHFDPGARAHAEPAPQRGGQHDLAFRGHYERRHVGSHGGRRILILERLTW